MPFNAPPVYLIGITRGTIPRDVNFEVGGMTISAQPSDALEVLLRFGALMLQSGNTAFRTRKWIDVMSPKFGFEAASVTVSLDSIAVSVRRRNERLTAMRAVGPPGINALRIAQLEELARTLRPGSAPAEIAIELEKIESAASQYSFVLIAAAVGLASGGFAFLSGGAAPE